MNNGRILIIERDRFYRELYLDLLSGVDYEVSILDNYEAGNMALSKFDLIICEPGKYKNEFASMVEKIKQLKYTPEILIVTSANISAVKASVQEDELHYTYIKKPFDDSKFLHIVANIIAQRRLFIEKEKLAKEGMEYLILLEVYKRSSDILSQSTTEGVLKKLIDAVVVELKLAKAMLWFRESGDTFNLVQSFGYESESYDEAAAINWKSFRYRSLLKDGYYIAAGSQNRKTMYILVQEQGGHIYAILKLTKKKTAFTIQDLRVVRTLSTFGGIAISNSIKLSQKVTDTLKAANLPIYSHRYFIEYTENEIKRSHRVHGMFSVAIISIENYRELVETFGKSYVEDVILKITVLINDVIRDADTLSASEYSNMLNIFLPDTDYFGSIITMRRIKNQLKQTLYVTDGAVTKKVELVIGSATYPSDGTTAQTLLSKAYKMAKKSSSGKLKELASIESLGFVEFSDNILKIFGNSSQKESDVTSAVFTVTEERVTAIINLLSGDVLARPFIRGLLFLGMPSITKDVKIIKEQYKLYNSNTKFYLLGVKQPGKYIDISYAPIMIINEEIGNRYFMLSLNEEYAYGFIAHNSKDKQFSVFHTSDPIIVEELIAVLQEKYFLQRQM